MKKILIGLLLTIVVLQAFSQTTAQSYQAIDAGFSAGKSFSSAFSYVKMFGVGKHKRFGVGYGIRLSSFWAKDIDMRTAPASLTSGTSSFAALFAEDLVANIDTFRLNTIQVNALNVSINLQYALSTKVEVGMNIDAIGFTFGATQQGRLIANASKRTFANGSVVSEAMPTTFNLLLVSDSDLGSLNSEIFVRYWLNEKVAIRAGLSFMFSEYTTTQKVNVANEQNDRWRYKSLLPLIAISYKL